MPSIQIPNNYQPALDKNGFFTTPWFTYFQGIYKALRANLPTKLSGILNINAASVSNAGGGTDDLITYTLPANMMKNNGDYLEVEGWGTIAANGNNKTITVNFGSQVIYTTDANAANSGTWSFRAKIVRKSQTTQDIDVDFLSNNTTLQNDSNYPTIQTDGIQDLTNEIIIKCTGTGTSDGDITQKIMIIKLSPND